MNSYREFDTAYVRESLADEQVCLIDIRPVDAYNGWQMKGERRGGHIHGARSLPYKWITYIDWIEIVRSKLISPDQEIILYGYSITRLTDVAQRFLDSGYKNVGIYTLFLSEWTVNEKLPMQSLKRFEKLVYPEWVKDLMERGVAPANSGSSFLVFHCHYRNRDDYLQGHIPGAIELDTNRLESPETWNRRSAAELRKEFEYLGITADTTVILYGRFSFPDNSDPFPGSSAGQLAAIRCAFILMYAGLNDVRLLNGGIQSWIDSGLALTKDESLPVSVGDCMMDIPARPDLAIDTPGAKEILKSESAELICVRSYPEYTGEVSGYNYITKKGRIPGAVFGDCGSDAYHMENYRNLDHTCREYHEIEKAWKRAGIVPWKHNAFYCGTGWRGSEAWFNAYLMGWPRVSVYDGGWFEWSNDPMNPVESGEPGPGYA